MLGFFSKVKDDLEKVNKDQIYFVHSPDHFSRDEIKATFISLAKLYANKLNVDKVFLHFGKECIEYDFKV